MFQTPEPPHTLIELVSEWWKLLGLIGTVVLSILTYYKVVRGKYNRMKLWLRQAADAPRIIAEINAFEGGTFREWAVDVRDSIEGLRQVTAFHTARHQHLLDQASDPIVEFDRFGLLTFANRAFLAMTECSLEEVIDNNWRNIIATPDREEVVNEWGRSITLQADFKAKFRLALNDSEKWVRLAVGCVKDKNGLVVGYAGKMHQTPDPRTLERR
jgi:PAS domain S-box-containing protein